MRYVSKNRLLCTLATAPQRKPFAPPQIKKCAIVSTSRDIHRNLALEHWLYKNRGFDDHHLLMLWVNEPCVVIGRHQNPWTECNVAWLHHQRIPLARRNSGGGTVYHDAGNLNLTFFTPNAHYHRRSNLEFIAKAIAGEYGLGLEINSREDLAIRDYKVSGTAAKLARHGAYHHCTLLVGADKHHLRTALTPCDWRVETNATKSTKSKITNLQDECAAITIDGLILSIAKAYLQWNNTNEGNVELDNRLVNRISSEALHLQAVTPCEDHFPGLDAIHDEYQSWEWTFGKTPKFTSTKTFTTSSTRFDLSLNVESGLVTEIDIILPTGEQNNAILQRLQQAQVVIGTRYDVALIEKIEAVFRE